MVNFLKRTRAQMLTIIAGAVGFVAALLWRDVIYLWLEPYIIEGDPYSFTFSVIIITFILAAIVVMLTYLLGRGKK
jgi:uncharacterized membrane protein